MSIWAKLNGASACAGPAPHVEARGGEDVRGAVDGVALDDVAGRRTRRRCTVTSTWLPRSTIGRKSPIAVHQRPPAR